MSKYIDVGASGLLTQKQAINTSAGVGDADKIIRTNASGDLDATFLPPGVGPDTQIIEASEALSAGDLVNVFDAAGTPTVRKADANSNKRAVGFVLAAVSSGANATVYFDGTITGLSGLTPGDDLFLSDATPGALTDTPPSGSGDLVQRVGTAISTTEATFEPAQAITLA